MLTLLLLAWTALAAPPAPPAGLAVEVSEHPGELRWSLAPEGGVLAIVRSAGPDERPIAGACDAEGLTVVERAPVDPAWLRAVCGSLTGLAGQVPPGRADVPRVPEPRAVTVREGFVVLHHRVAGTKLDWRPRGWHLWVLGWWLALLAWLPRDRAPWGWGLAALAVRVTLTEPHVFMGREYPYDRLATATGLEDVVSIYGPTWGAFMGLPWLLAGQPASVVPPMNLVLSCLTVVALWTVLAAQTDRTTAHLGAALLAVMPVPVSLSQTETMMVLCGLLQITSVAGLVGDRRRDVVLSVLSVALLAWLRPLQAVFAGCVALALLARRRWGAGGVAAVVVVLAVGSASTALQADRADVLGVNLVVRLLDPTYVIGGTLLPTRWGASPISVAVLAVLAWRSPHRRLAGLFAVAFAVGTLPYLHFFRLTDVLRFQLPAQTWLVGLAALGLAAIPRRSWTLLGCVVAADVLLASSPQGAPFTWQIEHAWLERQLARLEPGAVLRVGAPSQQGGKRLRWMTLATRARVVPLDAEPLVPGEWVWWGREDAERDGRGCTLVPEAVIRVTRRGVAVEPSGGEVDVGLWRVASCDGATAPRPR